MRGRGNLVERGGATAARRIAPGVNGTASRVEYSGNQAVERGAVGTDLAFEFKALAHAHDGHAVVADGTGDKDRVARLRAMRADRNAFAHHAHSGGVDVAAVAVGAPPPLCTPVDTPPPARCPL